MFLTERRRENELMDQPGLDARRHLQALRGLRRVNAWSRTADVLWNAIVGLPQIRRDEGPLRVLDLASGGGDVALGLSARAAAAGVRLTVEGWDLSETAVAHARAEAERRCDPNVGFRVRDALRDPIDSLCDVAVCTLFLHHLEADAAEALLAKMAAAARRAVLVDDLRRSPIGYGLAWVGSRLLSRSRIVHVDGPLSVQGAFTESELERFAERAGLSSARIARHWPQRMLLTWFRP